MTRDVGADGGRGFPGYPVGFDQAEKAVHRVNVLLHQVQVNDQGRGVEFRFRGADGLENRPFH